MHSNNTNNGKTEYILINFYDKHVSDQNINICHRKYFHLHKARYQSYFKLDVGPSNQILNDV